MGSADLHYLTWVKSSYSVHENCVEVAGAGGAVAVRDSKDPGGPSAFPAAYGVRPVRSQTP
jgi:hypothetical protein